MDFQLYVIDFVAGESLPNWAYTALIVGWMRHLYDRTYLQGEFRFEKHDFNDKIQILTLDTIGRPWRGIFSNIQI